MDRLYSIGVWTPYFLLVPISINNTNWWFMLQNGGGVGGGGVSHNRPIRTHRVSTGTELASWHVWLIQNTSSHAVPRYMKYFLCQRPKTPHLHWVVIHSSTRVSAFPTFLPLIGRIPSVLSGCWHKDSACLRHPTLIGLNRGTLSFFCSCKALVTSRKRSP